MTNTIIAITALTFVLWAGVVADALIGVIEMV